MTVSLPTMYDAKPIFLYIILFFPGIINVTSEADKALSVRAIGNEVGNERRGMLCVAELRRSRFPE